MSRDQSIRRDNLERGIKGKDPKTGTFLGGPYDEKEQQLADEVNQRGQEIRAENELRNRSDQS